jgi:death-on-curing protein
MKTLTKEMVIDLHEIEVSEFGGLSGLRDEGTLEAALAAPFAAFGGYEVFPTLMEKATRLAFGLVKNHAFVDGNKRIGILAMATFLKVNGLKLTTTSAELVNQVWGLADGSITLNDFTAFAESKTQPN